MLDCISASWWTFLLRGILALALGILAFVSPVIFGFSLLVVFGAYAIVDGVFSLAAAFSGPKVPGGGKGWLIFTGIAGILAGILIFAYPGQAMALVIYFIGFWAIFRGVFEIIAAISLRKEITNEWALGLAGACSLIFGILVLMSPLIGGLAIIWLIGVYAIIAGLALTAFSFRLKKHCKENKA